MVENISNSRHTMERRLSVISSVIISNLHNEIANNYNNYCSALSSALDESTDIQDKPQLAIFLRYVSMNMEVKEELLDLIALKETTRGCDIKDSLDVVLHKAEVHIAKIVSVSTDGAPSMTGCKNRLIGIKVILICQILFQFTALFIEKT